MTAKEKCTQKIDYVRNAFWFSLGAYALATESPTKDYLEQYRINLSGDKICVLKESERPKQNWLSYEVAFSRSLDDGSAKLFVNQTFRYMILETFEAAKNYAGSENLLQDFQSQGFYSFTRHLRNAI